MRYIATLSVSVFSVLALTACNSSDGESSLESALNSIEPSVIGENIVNNGTVAVEANAETNTATVNTVANTQTEVMGDNKVIGQETPVGDNPVMNPAGETIFKTSQVLFPKGGERIEVGKSYLIRWESEGIKAVDLELHEFGRKKFTIAERVLAAPGNYSWTPSRPLLAGEEYKQCTVVMVDSDTMVAHGKSENAFMLLPASE